MHFAETLPAFFGVGLFLEQRGRQAREFCRQDAGEAVTDFLSIRRLIEVLRLLGELADQGTGFLLAQPLRVAALLPIGEVLLVDGASAELRLEDILDVWQAIEPLDQFFALFPVFEAAAQSRRGWFLAAGRFFHYGWRSYFWGNYIAMLHILSR